MNDERQMDRWTITIARLVVVLSFCATWQILSVLFPGVDFALSRPLSVATEIGRFALTGEIVWHTLATGGAALAGLVLGTTIGTALGLTTWFSRNATAILRPFVLALGALPVLAIAPLVIIWFGIGLKMKVALAALSTVFVSIAQASRGAESVSKHYIQMMRGMNASDRQIFTSVIVPGSLDWVIGAMKLNAGLALLGAFIGEFIASEIGLGHLVLKAANLYNTPRALAASFYIMVLAVIFDRIAGWIESHRHSIIEGICIPAEARGVH